MARPREFDRTEALEKAMQLFWAKGYADTSIGELVEQTGVNRHSLYAEFGSKWDLFAESLDFYMEHSIAQRTAPLRQPDASWQNVVQFMEQFLGIVDHPLAKNGCLMCNTGAELAAQSPIAAQKFEQFLGVIQSLLETALIRAQENQEIHADQDAGALSRFLANTVVGISISAKTQAGRSAVADVIQLAIQSVKATQ